MYRNYMVILKQHNTNVKNKRLFIINIIIIKIKIDKNKFSTKLSHLFNLQNIKLKKDHFSF